MFLSELDKVNIKKRLFIFQEALVKFKEGIFPQKRQSGLRERERKRSFVNWHRFPATDSVHIGLRRRRILNDVINVSRANAPT